MVTELSTPHLRPASATLQLGKGIIMKHRHINLQAQILCDPEHSQLEGERARGMNHQQPPKWINGTVAWLSPMNCDSQMRQDDAGGFSAGLYLNLHSGGL